MLLSEYISHDTSKYCKKSMNYDVDQLCDKICFSNNKTYISAICFKCYNDYVNNNKTKLRSVVDYNINVMNFLGNFEQSEELLLNAVKNGNIDALYNLSEYYGKINCDDLSMKYLNLAVDNNHIDALIHMAMKYEKIEYYQKAIDLGSINAIYLLGDSYFDTDYALCEKYLLQAIEKGNADAMFRYYEFLKFNTDIEPSNNTTNSESSNDSDDDKKYLLYLQMAADHDNINALFEVGYNYLRKSMQNEMRSYFIKTINRSLFPFIHEVVVRMSPYNIYYSVDKELQQCVMAYFMAHNLDYSKIDISDEELILIQNDVDKCKSESCRHQSTNEQNDITIQIDEHNNDVFDVNINEINL